MIADNLASVTHHIGEAARKAGRDPDSIHLIVVSKQVSSEKIIEAYQAGSKYFGENKVQEAVSKIGATGPTRRREPSPIRNVPSS